MNVLEKFKDINTFIFDVDGVLTDNTLMITEAGELLRTMNARDGFAMKLALESDYNIAIITGGKSEGVVKRLQGLGIETIYKGVRDKVDAFEDYTRMHSIDPGNILYMGDDLPDYDVMRRVGLPTCPADACPEIIRVAQYISPRKGGQGAVRDVIEKVLKLHNKWISIEDDFD
jgi:3-deoxy-D-manno-octulosonate 8-phosphate phosphatase (KDO 8-P phosphatase)